MRYWNLQSRKWVVKNIFFEYTFAIQGWLQSINQDNIKDIFITAKQVILFMSKRNKNKNRKASNQMVKVQDYDQQQPKKIKKQENNNPLSSIVKCQSPIKKTDEQYQASKLQQSQQSIKEERVLNRQLEQIEVENSQLEQIKVEYHKPIQITPQNQPKWEKSIKNLDTEIQKTAKSTAIKMQKFQFSSLNAYEKIEKAVFIVGLSRAGKSTIFLMLNNIDLFIPIDRTQRTTINVGQNAPQYFRDVIGHGGQAKTKLPNIMQYQDTQTGRKIFFIDCPGFIDSQGFEDQFTNKYYIMRVFNIVQEARFLLCIQENDISNDKRDGIKKSITGFLNIFKSDTPNLHKILDHTSIVMTKTLQLPQYQTFKSLTKDTIEQFKKNGLINQALVLSKISQSGRLYYLPLAKKTQQRYDASPVQQIKETQVERDFYRIGHLEDILFEFDQNEGTEVMKQKGQIFQRIYEYTVHKVIQMCQILRRAFMEISDNSIKQNNQDINQKTYKFIKTFQDYVNLEDIYQSKNQLIGRIKKLQGIVNKVELKCYEKDFAQILFLRQMDKQFIKIQEIAIKDQKDRQYKNILYKYLDNILNYGYIEKEESAFYNFTYILKRHIDYINIISTIRPKTRIGQAIDIFEALLDSTFKLIDKEEKFILYYKLRKSNIDQDYLNFSEKFFFQKKAQYKNEVGIEKKQVLSKLYQLLIAIHIQRAVLFQKNNKAKGAFIQYEKCRILSESYNSQKNSKGVYQEVSVKLYKRLGQLCEKELKAYSLAIEYYKVIQFNKSIHRCFNLKLNTAQKQKTPIYLQYSDFLGSICEFDKAKQILEEAFQDLDFQESNQFHMSMKIKHSISCLMNKKKSNQRQYAQRIEEEDIYNKPDQKKISETMSMELQQLINEIQEFRSKV